MVRTPSGSACRAVLSASLRLERLAQLAQERGELFRGLRRVAPAGRRRLVDGDALLVGGVLKFHNFGNRALIISDDSSQLCWVRKFCDDQAYRTKLGGVLAG